MNFLSIFHMEVKSYLSNIAAVFWTFAYPIMMLILLIALFDREAGPHMLEGFRARTAIGLVTLTLVSTAIFGLGQALTEMRKNHALLPYYLSSLPLIRVSLSIVLSRIAIWIIFSLLYIIISFILLKINYTFTVWSIFSMIFVLLAACLFCFSLGLGLAYFCRTSQTMIATANILNLYAIMSADVFIPREILPEWSESFVTTSPFYHLNKVLRLGLESTPALSTWLIAGGLATVGFLLIWLFSKRKLFLSAGSS